MFEQFSLERKVGVALFLGLGLALVFSICAYFAFNYQRTTAQWTEHTHEVLAKIAEIETHLLNAETGQRGYVITDSRSYLAPYLRSKDEANAAIFTLAKLVADNPTQAAAVEALQALVNAKLDELALTIKHFDDSNASTALQLMLSDRGYQLMQDIRRISAELSSHEAKLLTARQHDEDVAFHLATLMMVGALLMYSALVVFTFRWVRSKVLERRAIEQTLRDNESRIRTITDNIPALVTYVDKSERYRFVNAFVDTMLAQPAAFLMGRTMAEVCGPGLYQQLVPHIKAALGGQAIRFDGIIKAGHRTFTHDTAYIPDHDDAGAVRGFYAISFDITERKRTEEALFNEHERLDVTLQSIGDAVLTTDLNGRIEYLNPIAEMMTGWTNEDARGRPMDEVFRVLNASTRKTVPNPLEEAIRENQVIGLAADSVLIARDASETAIEDSAAPIRNRQGKVIGGVLVFHDVSEMRALAIRMTRMAHHDGLTDLPNRTLVRDRITQAISHSLRARNRVAVLFCDLDRFKQINDALGHACGDQLLIQVSQRLVSEVRAGDTVGRHSGDEFIVVLMDVNSIAAVTAKAEAIRAALARPYQLDGAAASMSASIGISIYPSDGDDESTLIRNADTAMYEAKKSGGNAARFFTSAMNEQASRRLDLQTRLSHALAAREFSLHYQPILTCSDETLVAAEALIRWKAGEARGHQPAEIIRYAEETGMIEALGEWVLNEACMQARRWQNMGQASLAVSVNVSALQLRMPNFQAIVAGALNASGLAPERLELELTESVFVDAHTDAIANLNALRALGVRLVIDDFGTGFSSLSYLKDLPVQTLKIDRCFVSELPSVRQSLAITASIIALAKTLGLTVVAEGVETRCAAETLREHGCDRMQGFLFGKPMPANEFETWMQTSRHTAQSDLRIHQAAD